jgi:hypothetical protein
MSLWNSQVAYPTSSPVGLQLSNPAVAALLKGAQAVDALDHVLYSTFRFKAATAAPTNTLKFFSYGLGNQIGIANSATEQYTAQFVDTNLERSFNLPAFTCMVVDSLQIKLRVTGSTDTTYPTSGAGAEEPTDTTAAAAISATNAIQAVQDQGYIRFHVGTKDYEDGPIYRFPCEFGTSGFSGSGSSTSTTANNIISTETVANNGFGYARPFRIQRLIPPLVNFWVDLIFLQAFTIPRQMNITCCLSGTLYRAVQ